MSGGTFIFLSMGKILRILIFAIATGIILFVSGLLIVNTIIKNKVENFVETRLPAHIIQNYETLSVDLFEGTLTFKNANVNILNKETKEVHTYVHAEKFIIEDISYWDYLYNNQIHIEDVKIKKPVIRYYKDRLSTSKKKDSFRSAPLILYKPVLIDELSIDNTNLTIFNNTQDSITLFAKNLTLEVDDILIDQQTLLKRLPLKFGDYDAKVDSIFVKVSPYENLTSTDFALHDKKAVLKNIHLKTKYSREEHARIIPYEKDHYNLQIDSLEITDINFGFKNRKLLTKSNHITFYHPYLDVFRNKLIRDDPNQKPLYSKMLRDLPINVTVNSLFLKNAAIKYTEKVKVGNPGGIINFSNIEATLQNVSNTYKSPTKTQIAINANFMDNTPFNVSWSFDINNTQDQFTFKANAGRLAATKMNKFTEPNLHVRLEGETTKTYFTIHGNNNTSHVDMKIKYDDFKVTILNDDGKRKKWLLSTLANLIIKKSSNKKEGDFREGSGEAIRNQKKSFFNYLWLNMQQGLKASLTGKNKENK